jgi:hypothetical protein
MPAGEFEYIKPPQLYPNEKTEEDFLPHLTAKYDQAKSSNPLISGKRPLISEENEVSNKPDEPDEIAEVEIVLDDSSTSTHKIIVKKVNKPVRGRIPILYGQEQEIITKYNKGMILEDLARQYGVSVPCVSRAIVRGGGTIRNRGRRKR